MKKEISSTTRCCENNINHHTDGSFELVEEDLDKNGNIITLPSCLTLASETSSYSQYPRGSLKSNIETNGYGCSMNFNAANASASSKFSPTKKVALASPKSKVALESMSPMARIRHLSQRRSESKPKRISSLDNKKPNFTNHISFDSQEQEEDPEDIIKKKHKKWQKRRQMASELEAASMRAVENYDDNDQEIHSDETYTSSNRDETNMLSTNGGSSYYDDSSQSDFGIKIQTTDNLDDDKNNGNNTNKNGIRNANYYRNRREQQRIELERSQREDCQQECFEYNHSTSNDCDVGSNIVSLPVDLLRRFMSKTCGEMDNLSSDGSHDASMIDNNNNILATKTQNNLSPSASYDDDEQSNISDPIYSKKKTSRSYTNQGNDKENNSYGNRRNQHRGRERALKSNSDDKSDCSSSYTNSEQSFNDRANNQRQKMNRSMSLNIDKDKDKNKIANQANRSTVSSSSSTQKGNNVIKSKGWSPSPPSVKTNDSLHSKSSSSFNTKSLQSKSGSSANIRSPLNEFLDEASIEGIDLLLHSKEKITKDDKEFTISRPIPIRAFIKISDADENSQSISSGNSSGQPSLVWEREIDSENGQFNHHNDGIKSQGMISLFDIKSIRKATLMNLKPYPYAIAGSSLVISIENRGGVDGFKPDIVLEAESEARAKKLIHGLRRIIARLSYNLITGNTQICSELLMKANNMNIIYGDGKSVNNSYSDEENSTKCNTDRASQLMNGFTHHLVEKSILKVQRRKHKKKIHDNEKEPISHQLSKLQEKILN